MLRQKATYASYFRLFSKGKTGLGTLATHNAIHTSHHTTPPMSLLGSVDVKLRNVM